MGVFHSPFRSHTWPPGVGNRWHFMFSTRNRWLKTAKRLFLAIFDPFGLLRGLLGGWKRNVLGQTFWIPFPQYMRKPQSTWTRKVAENPNPPSFPTVPGQATAPGSPQWAIIGGRGGVSNILPCDPKYYTFLDSLAKNGQIWLNTHFFQTPH